MKKYFEVLTACPLFADIAEADIQALLRCLSAAQKRYDKNSFIWGEGDTAESIGIVLAGAVHVLREDFWGRRHILTRVEAGGLFGEAFAYAGAEKLPVSVMAAEETVIVFVNGRRIVTSCSSACTFHAGLIKNLTLILARRNMMLTQKLEHITQPTTREKLLSYLSAQARIAGSSAFDIPFNREELADYLSVERSAMSAELSKMRRAGLMRYRKNHFELLR
ncbi:MAG: Crp/Fnr family transcriptional regulator [Oscillospiraceae bacterium]|nr:Crp/Fnr family transcriptional regulator [Oscillospiraceae bacterium]